MTSTKQISIFHWFYNVPRHGNEVAVAAKVCCERPSRCSHSTKMFVNALIQYNSTVDEIESNIRFNWSYKPLSDLFLVYNERRSTTGGVVDRALIAKLTYIFDL